MSRVAGVVTCGAIAALAHGTSETMSIARGDGRPSPVPAAPLAVAIGAIARAVAFADATSRARTLALESGEKNASTIARPRQGVVNLGAYARVCARTKS